MNFEFLKEKIKEKFKSQEGFADAIGVTRPTVSAWLNDKGQPEEHRFFDIINALELTEQEVDRLLNIPQVSVVFRKIGGSQSEQTIKEKSKDLADTFFKIDGSAYVVKGNLLSLKAQTDPLEVANHIRRILCIEKNEPVVLNEVLVELKKNNINVFFVPFEKIGITLPTIQTSHKEVAFTALKGDKKIIFVDTKRTRDECNFDICHELAHIVLDHTITNDDEERFCNKVAQELVYPIAFLTERKTDLSPFLNARNSWPSVVSKFNHYYSEYDWSPKGLALALKENGLIKKDSHELKRLMKLHSLGKPKVKMIDDHYFNNFDVENFDKLAIFFNETIFKDKDVYKPFIEIKDAALSGRISPRKFADLLNIDSGDADELVRSWETEIGAEDSQDDDPTATEHQ
jgi:Zn-dependent peptidase ImmA (M78 family)